MTRRLVQATEAARHDNEVCAIVLAGAGDTAFSAGSDLGELIPRLKGEPEILVPDPSKRFFSDVFLPVIAAVNALCLAGGFEVLLGTDIRIAAEHAVFGLPEVRWGRVPGGRTHVRLPQQVPWPIAMQLPLTGDHIDAPRAAAYGLVNGVVPAGQMFRGPWRSPWPLRAMHPWPCARPRRSPCERWAASSVRPGAGAQRTCAPHRGRARGGSRLYREAQPKLPKLMTWQESKA